MCKRWKKLVGICLCVCLLTGVLPVFAEDSAGAGENTLAITNETEFLAFAENCRFDQYSRGLRVSLDADLNLEGTEFQGVPIFMGTLEGNNHTISGLSIGQEGSAQGLFRYLGESAVVRNLTVQGKVTPTGSQTDVGGIVGINSGVLEQCRFEGETAGSDRIGGVAGTNRVSGILDGCTVEGSVHGAHFIGGLAGENYGVVRNSTNAASVNVTAQENEVNLSSITLETVTGTEAANTVTNVGGIAGSNNGVIRDCENQGRIGYRQMGYNIGGIAGSQLGYMENCTNAGEVYGRKEVGGIVGQMEPISKVEYSADTLQILSQQLSETTALAARASGRAQSGAETVNRQIDALQGHTAAAEDAVKQLLPDRDNPSLPDPDTVTAAHNALTGSLTGAQNSMEQIAESSRNSALSLAREVTALTNQMHKMSATVNNASEHLGGSITDVSDEDTEKDLTGKVYLCHNHGAVQGDRNVGGIVGAVAWENDLDPEDDVQIQGQRSLNFDSQLRSVIRSCQNDGAVSGKKRQVGGIVGYLSLGLAKECVNTGEVEAPDGTFVGGIAGRSGGFLRDNSAKCRLEGISSVGGIAGSGTIVSGCRSLVEIRSGAEKLGAVLGQQEEGSAETEHPVEENYYMIARTDLGGVDGISYAGQAEPMAQEAFLALEGLPEAFRQSTVTFADESGERQTLVLPLGSALAETEIPEVPIKDGHNGSWDGLEELGSGGVFFDHTFTAVYDGYEPTIRSQEQRENGRPILLAEGAFAEDESFALQPLEELPEGSGRSAPVEGWELPEFSVDAPTRVHLSCPEGHKADAMELRVRGEDGSWRTVEPEVQGSYLVFAVEPTDTGICLFQDPFDFQWVAYTAGAAVVAALLAAGIILYRKKKLKSESSEEVTSKV